MIESMLKILQKDGSTSSANEWEISRFESFDIPILYLSGSINGMTKGNKVTLSFIWRDLSGTCTLKWQGSSSVTQFQKKNYTIEFDKKFEAVKGWGEQQKYCLKSNFNDPSNYRNLLCATLWGKAVEKRATLDANLKGLPNYGAVDGFPIIVSLNGEFHGLYTWNVPKDEWMFGMTDKTKQQAIVCADITGGATDFKSEANFSNDFELEYSSDDESDWVISSVNNLIRAVQECNMTNISKYLDLESAIDYYIHTVITKNTDATFKNYIMVTFDGTKWIFSAYDMDTVFGSTDYGASFTTAAGTPSFESMASSHALFDFIWKYMRSQLRDRYKELRENVYNEVVVSHLAYNFASKIPLPVSLYDLLKHNRVTASSASNIEQILTYLRLRLPLVDEWIENTDGEQELPDVSGYTNLVPSSINSHATGETPTIYGEDYNGDGKNDGYKEKIRLSSSGTVKENQNYHTLFGYIAVKGGDTIRLRCNERDLSATPVIWYNKDVSTNYICLYDSTFNFKYCGHPSGIYGTNNFVESMSTEGNVSVIKLKPLEANTEYYIRMCVFGDHSESGIDGSTAVITVNQEITD